MKIKLLTAFVLTLLTIAFGYLDIQAQKKITDREMEGLKDTVKSVVTEVEYLNPKGDSLNQPREKDTEYYFDKEGNVKEIVFPELNAKEIFSIIDGFKTYKNTRINEEPKSNKRMVVIDSDQKSDKPVPSDQRYNVKFTYEYDTQGRIKVEEQYFNNGKLYQRTGFKYDEKGRLKGQIADNTSDTTIYSFKYDEKGNLTEQLENQKVKQYGIDRTRKTIYSDYKIDSKGNWTQRTETSHVNNGEDSFITKKAVYKKLTYH